MCQQFLPAGRARVVGAIPEKDVLPGSKRFRAQLLVESMRLRAGVYFDIAKILPGGLAHGCLHIAIQGLSAAAFLVDAPGGIVIDFETTVAAALCEEALHRPVANLLLDSGQR